jgi:hypothetical protein
VHAEILRRGTLPSSVSRQDRVHVLSPPRT